MKHFYALLLLTIPLVSSAQTDFISTQIPDLSAYTSPSFSGLGEYQIDLDTEDGVLDKPIFIIDGFDPLDTRSVAGIHNLLDYTSTEGTQNLASNLRAEGFDVITLNFPQYLKLADNSLVNINTITDVNNDMIIDEIDFPAGSTYIDGGADYIERNAMLLVTLIQMINTQKIDDAQQNVIIGPSMGGLISRYALNYMENQDLNHDTRLWLSFDAPHHGANVPLGLQHQFNFLAFGLGEYNVEALQPLVTNFLSAPASKQMLIDHYQSHLQTGSNVNFDSSKTLPEAHPFRAIFNTHLNALTTTGYPETTRNVAMINGSGIGNAYQAINNTDINPGHSVINQTFSNIAPGVTANIEVNFTPASVSGAQRISKIQVVFGGFIDLYNSDINAEAPTYSDGVDAASGGLFNIGGLSGELPADGIAGNFLNGLTIDKFSFIPSVSAMALNVTNNEINWYHDINLGPVEDNNTSVSNNTPFVNWHMPDDNENHIQLTPENVTFALNEIILEPLFIPTLDNTSTFKLAENPIKNTLTILNTHTNTQATIYITDVTGKMVYQSQSTLSNRTQIPLQLTSGLYILNITDHKNQNYRTKFIIK
ncbi:T9SS type A sorting domain-containing protein [Lacinutrix undariae]